MKIHVKSSDRQLNIPIPTGLVFGELPLRLWLKLAKLSHKAWSDYIPEDAGIRMTLFPEELSEEAVLALSRELMRIKRRHGSWKLVEVMSSDGDEVIIEM